MITLYHAPRSRSSRFIFLLEELGAPYDLKEVNIRRGDGSGALDPANPHPHGKVPVIQDGDTLVYESIAIALYLTDKFPAAGIGPVAGDPKRGAYLTWLAYYAGVMEPAWMSAFMKWEVPRGTAGWVKTDEVMELVNATLSKGPYI
ncbi:MAG TPA: glutathione S-transferase, partial [Rhizomicrobium sp.]|nr:glutathione S-transferase [Rhizomicrobium sp.]